MPILAVGPVLSAYEWKAQNKEAKLATDAIVLERNPDRAKEEKGQNVIMFLPSLMYRVSCSPM